MSSTQEPATRADPTEYVILEKRVAPVPFSATADIDMWIEQGRVKAVSTEAAIRQWFEGGNPGEDDATFVAVPARSWNPRTIKVETRRVVSFT